MTRIDIPAFEIELRLTGIVPSPGLLRVGLMGWGLGLILVRMMEPLIGYNDVIIDAKTDVIVSVDFVCFFENAICG